jgi:hypothetical protein
MLRTLMDSMSPQITVAEIRCLLGFNDRASVQQWLQEHKLKPVAKWRYRRLEVINARDEDLSARKERQTDADLVNVELTREQLEGICWLIADELTSEMLEPVHGEHFLNAVHAWRKGRHLWVDRYLQRYIDNRENVEDLGRALDSGADLLEQLAAKLPS